MKKIISFLCLVAFSAVLAACGNKPQAADESTLTNYQTISLKEVVQKIQKKEDFYLYVGRETCRYCAQFSPNLEKAISNTQVTVFYLDTDEEDQDSAQIFVEKEGIKSVPNLAYYKSGQKVRFLEKGSEASIEEIEEFLKEE